MAAADVIKQFLVSLGYQVDKSSEREFSNGIAEATKKVGLFVAGVQMMAGAIWASVMRTAEGLDNLNDISERVNVPVDKIEELGYIASQTGSSVEAVHASLEGLNSVIGQAALGVGRGAMMFKKLGLAAKNSDGSVKGTAQVLDEIRGKIKDMSKGEQMAFLQRLGIDRTMFQMLSGDVSHLRDEFRKMYDAVGVDTNEAALIAGEFMDEWGKLSDISSMLYRAINIGFMKKFKDDLTRLRKMIIENADKIKRIITSVMSFIMRLAGAIGAAVMRIISWIQKAVDWYSRLNDKSKNLIMTAGALIAAWKLLNMQFLATPLGMLIAALTGLFLIVDDLLTYLEGGETAIDWSQWETEIAGIMDWFSKLWSSLENGLETVGKWLENFWEMFDPGVIFEDIIEMWEALGPAGQTLIKTLGGIVAAWKVFSLAFAVSPIGAVILVVGGLLAVLGDLFKYLDGGKDTMIDWSKWKKQIDPLVSVFRKMRDAIAPIFEKYGGHIRKFALSFAGIFLGAKVLVGTFSGVAKTVKSVLSPFKSLFDICKSSYGTIQKVAGGLGKFGGVLGKFGGTIGSKVISVIGKMSAKLWEIGGSAAKLAADFGGRAISAIGKFSKLLGGAMFSGIKKFGTAILRYGPILGKTVASGVVKLGSALANFSVGLVTKVIPAVLKFTAALLANPMTWIVIGVIALIAALYLLYKHWDVVKAAVADFVQKTVDWFKGLGTKIGDALAPIYVAITDWFASAKDWVVEKFFELIQWFKDLPGRIGGALMGLVDIIAAPFKKAYDYVTGLWNDFMGIFTTPEEEAGEPVRMGANPERRKTLEEMGYQFDEAGNITREPSIEESNKRLEARKTANAANIAEAANEVRALGEYTNAPPPAKQAELRRDVSNNQVNNIKSENTFNITADNPGDAANAVAAKSDNIARNNATAIKPMSKPAEGGAA